ncbi:bifunctional protein-serine/threonine kinase/phosphatase [Alteromonas lipotrueiana]|uniref:bifunctional protein-serine/threonine kinase/phosphatase n=1 Tax=Alteromonas lipotrueiana TaxID=2803815 RepID=UPI001C4387C4|nr:bifunctional protein-serine/threonine kinase/phosphatase [Alteromonas lipotrueiana]
MLKVSLGQHSSAGEKTLNQDSHGAHLPLGSSLQFKGAVVALADGISSSPVSDKASQTAISQFLHDYYCTSDSWSVTHAGEQVIQTINRSLLNSTKTSKYWENTDHGYVCTFSALVAKHRQGYLFHVGDSRIYRWRQYQLEQLTRDHRQWHEERFFLSNALGLHESVAIDTSEVALEEEDIFILATDGLHEYLSVQQIISCLNQSSHDLNVCAKQMVQQAFDNGSNDNLTVQLLKIDSLPEPVQLFNADEVKLPVPPVFNAGETIDDYLITRVLYSSARSHIYLAKQQSDYTENPVQYVIKAPSQELANQREYLDSLLTEEWVARRISSVHIIGAPASPRNRTALYTVLDYVPGQTLAQWLRDNPDPDIETIRGWIEQIASGLLALHRADIVHQDLRPENIMINSQGTLCLIDLGSASIAGLNEFYQPDVQLTGAMMYCAPECFLGEPGSVQSDLYSLAVLTYYLLSQRYPYGAAVPRATTVAAQHKLCYRSVLDAQRHIPGWLDDTLKKALHPNPAKRYSVISAFLYDLRHPNSAYLHARRPPLIQRHPVRFWQGVSALLFCLVVILLNLQNA